MTPKTALVYTENTTPAKEWREAIIELGVEVDTHQDGDAFIRTFTFNDAQLEAFLNQHSAHLVERMERAKRSDLPKKLPNPFYPKEGEKFLKMEGNINFMEGFNQALDQAIDIVKDKTNGI
jgi:predicted metal-dependent phosphoesterase TrpH